MSKPSNPADTDAPASPATKFGFSVGDEIRGDQIVITARKLGKPSLIRRSGNHKGSEILAEKDARAKVIRAYTTTAK